MNIDIQELAMAEAKVGMKRERWEEIKVIAMRGDIPTKKDYRAKADALLELVNWIIGNDTTFPLEFLDTPQPEAVVIDGPGVELKKGFVGITADGRKATVFCACIGCEPGAFFNVMLDDEPREESRSYDKRGTPVNPGSPRIVAPYPAERPFDGAGIGDWFFVLNTNAGEVSEYKLIHVSKTDFLLRHRHGDELFFFPDGTPASIHQSAYRVLGPVSKHLPEPSQEARLLEPVAPGEWFAAERCSQKKVRVVVVSAFGANLALRQSAVIETFLIGEDGRFPAGRYWEYELTRPVRPSAVEPYTDDADKGAMFGKTVRRKSDGAERRICRVDDDRVEMEKGAIPRWSTLATDFEHLDGSPIGSLVHDTAP